MKQCIIFALVLALLSVATASASGTKEATGAGVEKTAGQKTEGLKVFRTLAEYERQTGNKIRAFNEAPMLAEMVKAGKLPPVEQRLPEASDIMVIQPVEEIGQYGGTWRRAWLGASTGFIIRRTWKESIIRYDNDIKKMPQVAKGYEVSRDGKTFTFYLRKGLKWSNGQPFNADDMLFYHEDILKNEELSPRLPTYILDVGGKAAGFEKVDDYTVRFIFTQPSGMFLEEFSAPGGGKEYYAPKHYLTQYHPRYTDKDRLAKMAKDAGFEQWHEYFKNRNDVSNINNVEMPTIFPWKLKTPLPATRAVWERNPYYWKVDIAGNQLPYIDYATEDLSTDHEMIVFKAMSGEIDFQNRYINNFVNYTLFKQNEEKGDYRVVKWGNLENASLNFTFSQTYSEDPVLAEFIRNPKFRRALSYAIDRQDISNTLFGGLGVPGQPSPSSWDVHYSAEWTNAHIEYEPAKSNALLDEIGLTKRDTDGFRLRPDGKPFELIIEATQYLSVAPDILEMATQDWRDVGIKASVKMIGRSLWFERAKADLLPINTWACGGTFYELLPYIAPIRASGPDSWGGGFYKWYISGGKEGVEPTGDPARMLELYDKLRATVSEEDKKPYIKEMIDLHIKNLWWVGTVGQLPDFAIVKNNFRNVPEGIPSAFYMLTPRNAEPEQFFIEQ